MKSNDSLSRRDFLLSSSLLLGSAALNPLYRFFKKAPDDLPEIYLPFVARDTNRPPMGRVIHVRSTSATSWTGQKYFWNYVNQNTVNSMVDQGLMLLTMTDSVTEAWRALIPDYQIGQKIAIKVNFNNATSCTDIDGGIDAIIEPVNALVSGLELIGVQRSDVCVYDAVRALPTRFTGGALNGISFYDGGYCQTTAGFSTEPDSYITFHPPPGVSIATERVTDVLRSASYLINMPIMKGDHPFAGVTLGFKNHFGSIISPGGMHKHIDVVGKPPGYRTDYNPLVDIYQCPHIGAKTVLTVGDAIFAAIHYSHAPQTWSTFGNQLPNSLFFSADPVAIDCVMHDYVLAQPGTNVPSGANNYLVLAANARLGVFESVNPWSSSYSIIDYQKLDLTP